MVVTMNVSADVDRGSDGLDVGLLEEDFLSSVADLLEIAFSQAAALDKNR
jgi:hypothetical protein